MVHSVYQRVDEYQFSGEVAAVIFDKKRPCFLLYQTIFLVSRTFFKKHEKTLLSRIFTDILAGHKFNTLQEFEDNYGSGMNALNYSWFQARYHQIAKVVYDKTGNNGLVKIFEKFNGDIKINTNTALIDFIDKEVSQEMASSFSNF